MVSLWCGRTEGGCTVTSLPNFLGRVDLLTHGAPQARFARQGSAKPSEYAFIDKDDEEEEEIDKEDEENDWVESSDDEEDKEKPRTSKTSKKLLFSILIKV